MCITDYFTNSANHSQALERMYNRTSKYLSVDYLARDLAQKITAEQTAIKRKQIKGLYILAAIKDNNQYKTLLLRYYQGAPVLAVADILLYSEGQIYRFERAGVLAFDQAENELNAVNIR